MNDTMTVERLQQLLDEHDDGILRAGAHEPGRQFCALEFDSIVRGRVWSDNPTTLPDLRPLNDARWSSDEARTAALLPVMSALWSWSEWTHEQRTQWASTVAIETVRQIIAELPNLGEPVRQQCRDASTLDGARVAAAAEAAMWAAEEAARAAAEAAMWAAEAAAEAAAGTAADAAETADTVLNRACAIWITAAVRS